MRAGGRIEAAFRQSQALDGTAGNQMLFDDFPHILGFDESIPDGPGIDDNGRPVLALVEASGLVHANALTQARSSNRVLEQGVDLALTVAGA